MNSKYLLGGFALLIIIVVGGFLLLNSKTNYSGNSGQTTKLRPTEAQQIKEVTVTVDSSGFNPATVNIKAGTRVVWTNKSGQNASVNSDVYPNNLLWSFLNLGQFDNGSNISVVFEKTGKYTYHNQLNPDQKGAVIVQ